MPIKSRRSETIVTNLQSEEQQKKARLPKGRPDTLYSTFLITVNSNKSFKANDPELPKAGEVFKKAVDEYLTKMENKGSFILFRDDKGEWNDKKIKSFKSNSAIERSSKGMLHAHMVVVIKHWTRVNINVPNTKAFFLKKLENEFNIKNVYVFVKYYRNKRKPEEVLDAYLNKNKGEKQNIGSDRSDSEEEQPFKKSKSIQKETTDFIQLTL